jgi:hypothetical protein
MADMTSTWVYGKYGWYCAMWGWREWYQNHLESLGYRVVRAVKKPDIA